MVIPDPEDIALRAAAQLFSKPLLTNVHRSVVAEAIVSAALEPDWTWCAGDYSSYDFKHPTGVRLEVKQSASLQSWNASTLKRSKCSFDIAERTGEWVDGTQWVEGRKRNADIYVFCHHPLVSQEADHRDPAQWRFFVIAEKALPTQKSIKLGGIEALAKPVRWAGLKFAVAEIASTTDPSR